MIEPTLFDVPEPGSALQLVPAGSTPAPTRPVNGGQVVAGFIDFCKANGVVLTSNLVGRYGKLAKRLLDDGMPLEVIVQALKQMLADRVVQWPNRLEQYVMEAQQGPEMRRAPLAETFDQRRARETTAWARAADAAEARGEDMGPWDLWASTA